MASLVCGSDVHWDNHAVHQYHVHGQPFIPGWPQGGAAPAPLGSRAAVMINLDQYSEAGSSDSEEERPPRPPCGKKVEAPEVRPAAARRDVPEPVPEPDAAGPAVARRGACVAPAGPAPPRPAPLPAPWREQKNWPAGTWRGGLSEALAPTLPDASLPWRRGPGAAAVARRLADHDAGLQQWAARWAAAEAAKPISSPVRSLSSVSTTEPDTESEQDDGENSVSEPEKEAPQGDAEAPETGGAAPLGVLGLLAWRAATRPGPDTLGFVAAPAEEASEDTAAAAPAARPAPPPPAPAPPAGETAELVVSPASWAAQMRARRGAVAAAALSAAAPGAVAQPRRTDEQGALAVSGGSWVAQQRARRRGASQEEDAEIARSLKCLLNKLTLEKFQDLSAQIVRVPMRTAAHVEVLITEVFEKAVTQHHFIDMYADLCTLLHEHFAASPVGSDPKFNFKKLLLNECQSSFERNLEPPKGLDDLDAEERTLKEFRYKHRMMGNIKFIGALLVRKMLAGKVLLAILQELISDPTPEALESVAALLTATGPVFDSPDWAFHSALEAVFAEVRSIARRPSCEPRSRCLLLDVLDLRRGGWKAGRRLQDAPATLKEVSDRRAAEEFCK